MMKPFFESVLLIPTKRKLQRDYSPALTEDKEFPHISGTVRYLQEHRVQRI